MYNFTPHELSEIESAFGKDFIAKVRTDLVTYSERWGLSDFALIDYFSINCLFLCNSECYGGAVLKICGNTREETIREACTLTEYDGVKYCKIFASDLDNGVILIERLIPGIQLKKERSLMKRLSVFADLFTDLHITPVNPDAFPSYVGTAFYEMEEFLARSDYAELRPYVLKATEMLTELSAKYNRDTLIHGDLHGDNILLDRNDTYKIVDPHGFIADPVFELARFLTNEYDDDKVSQNDGERKQYMLSIMDYFESKLFIPRAVMCMGFYLDMTLFQCWYITIGEEPKYSDVKFAEYLCDDNGVTSC